MLSNIKMFTKIFKRSYCEVLRGQVVWLDIRYILKLVETLGNQKASAISSHPNIVLKEALINALHLFQYTANFTPKRLSQI